MLAHRRNIPLLSRPTASTM